MVTAAYNPAPSCREISDYYSASKWDYRLYNGRFFDLFMHYGLWDSTTHTHRQALVNENLVLARLCDIKSSDLVADFGCGYGAVAIWLARNIGCRVTGITCSLDQILAARRDAHWHGVDGLVKFVQADFHNVPLPEAAFDVVIGIESICHSSRKLEVLQEAHRLLRSRGRIAVADGFLTRRVKEMNRVESTLVENCCAGAHVPLLATVQEFKCVLEEVGFSKIAWLDKTQAIMPTAIKVHCIGRFFRPFSSILSACGLRAFSGDHMEAFYNQYRVLESGLGLYGIFLAEKVMDA